VTSPLESGGSVICQRADGHTCVRWGPWATAVALAFGAGCTTRESVQPDRRAPLIEPRAMAPVKSPTTSPGDPFCATGQRLLKRAGYYSGPVDGTMDEETRQAVIEFQRAKGLRQSGVFDAPTWGLLRQHRKPWRRIWPAAHALVQRRHCPAATAIDAPRSHRQAVCLASWRMCGMMA
jgi:hypothetical protein